MQRRRLFRYPLEERSLQETFHSDALPVSCNCPCSGCFIRHASVSVIATCHLHTLMRVVRILSVLPGAVGVLCLLIGGISVYGIDLDPERVQIPVVPCTEVSDEGCLVGMTGSDLEVPAGFLLMDIELTIEWSEPSKSWIGVVDASYADSCPPDGDGLTACTKDDFEYISGGPESSGDFILDLQPGSYRFVSAGKEGADLDEQLVTITSSVGIAPALELLLLVIGAVLLIGAIEMIYPVEVLWKRFVDS